MTHRDDDNRKQEFSDEFLNAFVDNQLTLEEKDRAYLRVSQDEALGRRVCELRKLQDMVRLSYQDLPGAPARSQPALRHSRFGLGIAASVALAIGVALGWVLHQPTPRQATVETQAFKPETSRTVPSPAPQRATLAKTAVATPAPAVTVAASTMAAADDDVPPLPYRPQSIADSTVKVLIHVSQTNAANSPETLDEIENLVRYYREQHQSARVEVIINAGGLDLVRADTTRFAERIRRMQRDYDNLTFAACQNTIDRLKREQGITARLLPGVTVIDSGVAQIMRRQQQGWAYIRA